MLTLVEGLPLGSDFHASMSGDPASRGFDVHASILANLYDLTAIAGQVTESKGSKKPATHPRPGAKKPNQPRRGLAGLMAAIPRGGADG